MSPRTAARELEIRFGFRQVFSASIRALGYPPWITHSFEITSLVKELQNAI